MASHVLVVDGFSHRYPATKLAFSRIQDSSMGKVAMKQPTREDTALLLFV
jgi:hypothetical protein